MRCAGFSVRGFFCCGARAPGSRVSRVAACRLGSGGAVFIALQHGKSSQKRGKPKSTALAGSFLTTGHQGSPGMIFKGFFFFFFYIPF